MSNDVMAELERVKEEVVFGFYEDQYPIYAQGYRVGAHELSSPLTAAEANGMINKIIDLEQQLAEKKKLIEILQRINERMADIALNMSSNNT